MALPFTFNAGEVAASSEVNENFEYLESIVGVGSTSARLLPSGDIVVGPRSNAQISARGDTAAESDFSSVHIGWNDELYQSGSTWKHRRFHDGEPAYALALGAEGIEFYASSRESGNLDSQRTLMAAIGATISNDDRDWFYIRDSFTTSNASPDAHQDIRSTLVFFNTPKTVYENVSISGSREVNAANYDVPTQAVAVLLSFEGRASSTVDSEIMFTRAASTRSQKNGFLVRQKQNTIGAGQGIVTLGMTGSYKNKFAEVRTNSWSSASLYILGYFI